MIKSIQNILERYKRELLSLELINATSEGALKNYQSLLRHVSTLELRENLFHITHKIKDISSRGALKITFEKICAARYSHIEGTALQYTAYPDSPTNLLFNELYDAIFYDADKNNFSQRLATLCPSIKYLLKIDCTGKFITHEYTKRIAPSIETKLENLDTTNLKATFSDVILDENAGFVLPVNATINKKYSYLTLIHNLLKEHYPILYKKLKSHNDDIRHLYNQIESINNNGTPPRKVIEELRNQLILSGSRVTGEDFASMRAQKAIERFHEYLNSLPPDFSKSLLEIKMFDRTLQSLMKKLLYTHDFLCVEQTANDLNNLLKNSENKNLLDRSPKISAEQRDLWIKTINKQQLALQGKEICDTFPPLFLSAVIKSLKIRTASEFGEFLANFHESFYELILKDLKQNPIFYFYDLQECLIFLSPEQKMHLIIALGKRLKDLVVNPTDYGKLLSEFDADHLHLIIRHAEMHSIRSFHDVIQCLNYLNSRQKFAFFLETKNVLNVYIKKSDDYGKFLSIFDPIYYSQIVDGLKDLPIKNVKELIQCTVQLILNERSSFFVAMKNKLKNILTSPKDLGTYLASIDIDNYPEFLNVIQDTIPIKNFSDFKTCIQKLPEKGARRYSFILAVKSHLPTFIQSFNDLKGLYEMDSFHYRKEFVFRFLGHEWIQSNIAWYQIYDFIKWCEVSDYDYSRFLLEAFGSDWLKTHIGDLMHLNPIIEHMRPYELKSFVLTCFGLEWLCALPSWDLKSLTCRLEIYDRKEFLMLIYGSNMKKPPRFFGGVKELLEMVIERDRNELMLSLYGEGSQNQNPRLLLSFTETKDILNLVPFFKRQEVLEHCFDINWLKLISPNHLESDIEMLYTAPSLDIPETIVSTPRVSNYRLFSDRRTYTLSPTEELIPTYRPYQL